MPRKNRHNNTLILPSRQITARIGRVFLLSCLAGLVLMGRSDNPRINGFKTRLMDGIAPVLAVAAAPFDAFDTAANGVKNWAATYSQNAQLKSENRSLMQWQATAKAMESENQKLRELLRVAPSQRNAYVTANFVSDYGSAFSHSALINAGSEQGIAKNQAVISERGLIGRTIEVSENNSRVMLLSDMNSRIPVMNERTREKMILVGKGNAQPILSYVAAAHNMKPDDRIITSGDGGMFPKAIPVGKIEAINAQGATAQLFANPETVEYVSVTQFKR